MGGSDGRLYPPPLGWGPRLRQICTAHPDTLKRNDYELVISVMRIAALPLASIRRPLERVLDEAKVAQLMESIAAEGQKEPIDVLEVNGQLWGFNGCHRVAAHERLGLATITARVRQANPEVLRLHML